MGKILKLHCAIETADFVEFELDTDGGVDVSLVEDGHDAAAILTRESVEKLREFLATDIPDVAELAALLRLTHLTNVHGAACARGMAWDDTTPEVKSPWLAVAAIALLSLRGVGEA